MMVPTNRRLLPFFLTAACVSCAGVIDVRDGFDAPALSALWSTKRFARGAVEMQPEVVRTGERAVKITLRQGDWTEKNDYPGGPILERAELEESRNLWAEEGKTYVQAFSVWLPRDFPIVPVRLVIAQWKQKCPQETCSPGNPLLAVRYSAGELSITAGPDHVTLYRAREDLRNRWVDFSFRLRFSGGGKGRVRISLNGRQVVDHAGTMTYSGKGGYLASGNRFYFKMGLYRDRMREPMTIFFDDYRKQELRPGGF